LLEVFREWSGDHLMTQREFTKQTVDSSVTSGKP
jgi:hypothetical protein